MQYAWFSAEEESSYKVALLVPNIRKEEINHAYLKGQNLLPDDLLVMTLHYADGKKKTPMSEMRAYITEALVPEIEAFGIQYVMCADGEYFKALTKATKVDAHTGYIMDSPYGDFKVVYVPFHTQIFYDPDKVRAKIKTGIDAIHTHRSGTYEEPGNGVIHFAAYPDNDTDIEQWLLKLLDHKMLTSDIEGFGLKHYDSGVGTISFAWNKHEGIAFPIDYEEIKGAAGFPYGRNVKHVHRRAMLKKFFELCREMGITIAWHNIGFDVYVLIYQLFMDHILDQEGLLYGMDVMLGDHGDWDCTKLITYLATNSCAGNKLGLKDQSQEFAGNYAVEEIKDITKIPLAKLLEYNLVDSLSTWYVYEKHHPTMVADQQLPVYKELFQPSMVDIIQMQLTGMPVNMRRVRQVHWELYKDQRAAKKAINGTKIISQYNKRLNQKWADTMNAKWKKKRTTAAEGREVFNPNSAPQLQDLLFVVLGLPVLGLTESNQPSTDGDTLKALQKHTQDADVIAFLKAMVDYKAVNKIITDFIPSLRNAQQGPDGWHYLFGNFNLGGTKSGRLSSSGPNLQNLPANSKYAKLIKSCFEAPPGWLFCGLDFASLEDRISALTTKDPNKLKVYTDGYDGHSLRAYSYFGEHMPDIDPDSVVSINSIQEKYKEFRQDSKVPTFLLTYQGTYKGIMEQCGFDFEKAKTIEERYHVLYEVSDRWVEGKLEEATRTGYVTVAFGLRLRTPLLHQVIRGTRATPFQAEAEGRTAGNALGQSYCLLNSRAGNEFNGKVRKSEHRLAIKPCAQIHDAQYFLVRDDIKVIHYANDNLVKAVQWQDDPAIWHDEVKLGGEFGIFYPTWEKEITIPNGATEQEIFSVIDDAMAARADKAKAA